MKEKIETRKYIEETNIRRCKNTVKTIPKQKQKSPPKKYQKKKQYESFLKKTIKIKQENIQKKKTLKNNEKKKPGYYREDLWPAEGDKRNKWVVQSVLGRGYLKGNKDS